MTVVIDSSGWLEYLADGPNADTFAEPIMGDDDVVVPSIAIFEVFRRAASQGGEEAAAEAAALLQQYVVVDLTAELALEAAQVALTESLPMADSIVLATARAFDAELWTQDSDFAGKPGVRYVPHKP